MEFMSKNLIKIDRELSELDKFAIEFTKILQKYTKYVIISGYVSILLGRSRMSEDIDLFVPKMDLKVFKKFIEDLEENDFYCLNTEDTEDIYDHVLNHSAIRFAKVGNVIPNIEFKFVKSNFDNLAFDNCVNVKLRDEEIIISNLELQIVFKEKVLKSQKDIEDARHIRNVAKGHLDENLIKNYGDVLDGYFKK